MIHLLRKLRRKESGGSGFASYLLYAVGEIVLVVAGILIALSLNNWSEERKQQQQLRNIFVTLEDDIRNDLDEMTTILEYYEDFEDEFIALMEGTMTLEKFKECRQCPYLVTGHRNFNIEDRAYERLKEYNSGFEEDSLVNHVVQTIASFKEDIAINDRLIQGSIVSDLEKWRDQYDWFPAFARQEEENEAYARYSVNSREFRNMTAWRYALVYTNYVPTVNDFKKALLDILEGVEQRLAE